VHARAIFFIYRRSGEFIMTDFGTRTTDLGGFSRRCKGTQPPTQSRTFALRTFSSTASWCAAPLCPYRCRCLARATCSCCLFVSAGKLARNWCVCSKNCTPKPKRQPCCAIVASTHTCTVIFALLLLLAVLQVRSLEDINATEVNAFAYNITFDGSHGTGDS
jgi:hypothetical protein